MKFIVDHAFLESVCEKFETNLAIKSGTDDYVPPPPEGKAFKFHVEHEPNALVLGLESWGQKHQEPGRYSPIPGEYEYRIAWRHRIKLPQVLTDTWSIANNRGGSGLLLRCEWISNLAREDAVHYDRLLRREVVDLPAGECPSWGELENTLRKEVFARTGLQESIRIWPRHGLEHIGNRGAVASIEVSAGSDPRTLAPFFDAFKWPFNSLSCVCLDTVVRHVEADSEESGQGLVEEFDHSLHATKWPGEFSCGQSEEGHWTWVIPWVRDRKVCVTKDANGNWSLFADYTERPSCDAASELVALIEHGTDRVENDDGSVTMTLLSGAEVTVTWPTPEDSTD